MAALGNHFEKRISLSLNPIDDLKDSLLDGDPEEIIDLDLDVVE